MQYLFTQCLSYHTNALYQGLQASTKSSSFQKQRGCQLSSYCTLHFCTNFLMLSLCIGVLNFHTRVLRVVGAGVSEDPGSLFLMTIGRKEVCFTNWGYQKECRATCNVEDPACGISDCREKRRQSVLQVYNGLVIFRRGNWTGWLMNVPVETLLRCRSSSMYFGGVNSCVGNILAKFWFPRWSASLEAYVLVLKESHQASLVNRTSNLITSLDKLERHRRSVSP
jgi:hypothetical protein